MTSSDEIRKMSQNYSASGFAANPEWEAMYRHGWNACEEAAAEIAARADARIAELIELLTECRDCVASDINYTLAQSRHEPAAVDYLRALLARVDAARAGNGESGDVG